MNFDVQGFIKSVGTEPMLWDMDHEMYHSHLARRAKWAEIGRMYGVSEMKAKKRFKSIRDEYRKETKRLTMGMSLSDRRMEWMESLSYLKNLRPRSRRPEFHHELAQLQEQSFNLDNSFQIKDEPSFNDDMNPQLYANGGDSTCENGNGMENGSSMDEDADYPQCLPSLPPPLDEDDEDMDCCYIPDSPLVPITILEHSPSPSPPPPAQNPQSIPKLKISRVVQPQAMIPEISITIESQKSPNQNGHQYHPRPSPTLLSTLQLKPKPLATLQKILPKPVVVSPIVTPTPKLPALPILLPKPKSAIAPQPPKEVLEIAKPAKASPPAPILPPLSAFGPTDSTGKVTLGAFIDHMIEQEPEQYRERFNLEILDSLVKIKRKFMEQRTADAIIKKC